METLLFLLFLFLTFLFIANLYWDYGLRNGGVRAFGVDRFLGFFKSTHLRRFEENSIRKSTCLDRFEAG